MENEYARPMSALERELQVLNQKAERDRTQKLQLIDKQFKFSYKTLQQRKDFWRKEQRKVCTVRICEPKAIVDIAMKDINEFSNFREVRTAYGMRKCTQMEEKHSRSISAPVRQRCGVESSVSFLQMKNIALIDLISEKERELRLRREREERERARRAKIEALHRRVEEFIERLKDKDRTDATEEEIS